MAEIICAPGFGCLYAYESLDTLPFALFPLLYALCPMLSADPTRARLSLSEIGCGLYVYESLEALRLSGGFYPPCTPHFTPPYIPILYLPSSFFTFTLMAYTILARSALV